MWAMRIVSFEFALRFSIILLSESILSADPVGLQLLIPDCCENKEVVPQKKYFGGVEGPGEYTWFRLEDKLDGPSLLSISYPRDKFICGHELNYTPSLDDVGYYMALQWIPTREDGRTGKPVIASSSDLVAPDLWGAGVVVREWKGELVACGSWRWRAKTTSDMVEAKAIVL